MAFFTCIGLALARRLSPAWAPAGAIAPAMGWGVFTAVSFVVQDLLGFSRLSTGLLAVGFLAAAAAALVRVKDVKSGSSTALPPWAYVLALAVGLIPLVGLLPKYADGGVLLGPTAFDHSKIAMVDAMTRLGLPAANPFFGAHGVRALLPYYYLWHFGAAQLSLLAGVSGWEADAAMTGFTAYASVLLMMGLANRLYSPEDGARPRAAIVWVALLSLAGSLHPLLSLLLGPEGFSRLLSQYTGLSDWMIQASWVPQHLASAGCVVLAILLLVDLSQQPRLSCALVLAALVAAGFGSSAWVGGITFVLGAAGAGAVGLIYAKSGRRKLYVLALAGAAVLAIVLAVPLLHAEFATVANRGGGAPVRFHPYEVLGPIAPQAIRRALDFPAFWLVRLPADLPAIYPAGAVALCLYVRRGLGGAKADPQALGLAVLTATSLCVAWLLVSTIGNNDLGWRAILPAILVLTPFAAAGLARWIAIGAYAPAALALALLACSLPARQVFQNIEGRHTDNAPEFAQSPALWAAVRRYAGPADRVANNPQFMDDMTDWPVNPSWAMLSNRLSCYSGGETARVFIDLPNARLRALDSQFTRVFAGSGTPDDVRQMAQDYGCKVVLLVESDDAWSKDPFAASPYYRLAEQSEDEWRIYVASPSRATP